MHKSGNSRFVANLLTFGFNPLHLTGIYALFLFVSALFSTAEKRDYEGVFVPCQTKRGPHAELRGTINDNKQITH